METIPKITTGPIISTALGLAAHFVEADRKTEAQLASLRFDRRDQFARHEYWLNAIQRSSDLSYKRGSRNFLLVLPSGSPGRLHRTSTTRVTNRQRVYIGKQHSLCLCVGMKGAAGGRQRYLRHLCDCPSRTPTGVVAGRRFVYRTQNPGSADLQASSVSCAAAAETRAADRTLAAPAGPRLGGAVGSRYSGRSKASSSRVPRRCQRRRPNETHPHVALHKGPHRSEKRVCYDGLLS